MNRHSFARKCALMGSQPAKESLPSLTFSSQVSPFDSFVSVSGRWSAYILSAVRGHLARSSAQVPLRYLSFVGVPTSCRRFAGILPALPRRHYVYPLATASGSIPVHLQVL